MATSSFLRRFGAVMTTGAFGLDFTFVQHSLRWISVSNDDRVQWLVLTAPANNMEPDGRFRLHRQQYYIRKRYESTDSVHRFGQATRRLCLCVALPGDYVDNGRFASMYVPNRLSAVVQVDANSSESADGSGPVVTDDDLVWQGALSEIAVMRVWPMPMIFVAHRTAGVDEEAVGISSGAAGEGWWWSIGRRWAPSDTNDKALSAASRIVAPYRVSRMPPDAWRWELDKHAAVENSHIADDDDDGEVNLPISLSTPPVFRDWDRCGSPVLQTMMESPPTDAAGSTSTAFPDS